MKRYRAWLKDGAVIDDAVLEIEQCSGSDIERGDNDLSVIFVADVDDIPSIEGMPSIESVEEIDDENVDDGRGLYAGLRRSG